MYSDDLVAARGQAVEVLEDVAVPAADARVLGDVDDPQGAATRVRIRAGVTSRASKKSDQRSQNSAL